MAGALVGLWRWRRQNLFFHFLAVQSLLGFFSEALGLACVKGIITLGRGPHNIPIFTVYMLCEVCLLVLALRSLLHHHQRKVANAGVAILILIWLASVLRNGLFYQPNYFYLAGAVFITALILWILKQNLETYQLSDQLPAYLFAFFGMLIFYGVSFEVLAFRYLSMALNYDFARKIQNILIYAINARMLCFIISFVLLRKKAATSLQPRPL